MDKKRNIILVGMPGAGKTYIGEKLSQKLQRFKFIDTDALIEQRTGMSIVDIFEKHGEEKFRQEESQTIQEILSQNSNSIIAVGGGAFNSNNIDILKQNGVVFYLKASVNLLYERVKNESTRPLLLNTDNVKYKLAKLLEDREDNFKKANFTISQEDYTTEGLLDFIIKKYNVFRNTIDILSYPVFVSSDEFDYKRVLEYVKGKSFIVIDERVNKLHGHNFEFAPKFVLKEGENQKNIKNYLKIIDFASKNKIERNDTLIAVGGGVTGDISGFAAATYMRGINLIHIPTTLLACVDSSIGGKTAINSDFGKNLIGAFYQPIGVFSNLNFLKTLDDKQFKIGLSEVLKYAFIENSCKASRSFSLFEILEHNVERILNRDFDIIEEIIRICIELKETVVLKDEKENGLRQILNFGHTYAHAAEKISNYKISHGQAVAQGMVFAFNLAYKKRLISEEYFNKSISLIKNFKIYSQPQKINKKMIEIMEHDKKIRDGKVNFILPYYPKSVDIVKIDPNDLFVE